MFKNLLLLEIALAIGYLYL